MKKKDIALIVVVAAVSLVLATLASSLLFGGGDESRQLTAEKVEPITSEFVQPEAAYFNIESINPTETIRIDAETNQSPFKQAE